MFRDFVSEGHWQIGERKEEVRRGGIASKGWGKGKETRWMWVMEWRRRGEEKRRFGL